MRAVNPWCGRGRAVGGFGFPVGGFGFSVGGFGAAVGGFGGAIGGWGAEGCARARDVYRYNTREGRL